MRLLHCDVNSLTPSCESVTSRWAPQWNTWLWSWFSSYTINTSYRLPSSTVSKRSGLTWTNRPIVRHFPKTKVSLGLGFRLDSSSCSDLKAQFTSQHMDSYFAPKTFSFVLQYLKMQSMIWVWFGKRLFELQWHPSPLCSWGTVLIGWDCLWLGPSPYVCFPFTEPGLCSKMSFSRQLEDHDPFSALVSLQFI